MARDIDRFEEVDAIFSAALDLPPPERSQYVETACRDDAALRRLVERLLSPAQKGAEDAAAEVEPLVIGGIFATPVWRDFASTLVEEGPVIDPGSRGNWIAGRSPQKHRVFR